MGFQEIFCRAVDRFVGFVGQRREQDENKDIDVKDPSYCSLRDMLTAEIDREMQIFVQTPTGKKKCTT
jgi:hypothetical protein